MTSSDWITIAGAAVTIVGMLVSIRQARTALVASGVAKRAAAAVQLAAVSERLKSAQEHIRDIAPGKVVQRGYKAGTRFDLIRREFDTALSALPRTGNGGEARLILTAAQNHLDDYQKSLTGIVDVQSWQRLQGLVQDAISDLTARTSDIKDGKS